MKLYEIATPPEVEAAGRKAQSETEKKLSKKFNISRFESGSIGLDEEKGIWYGWSHRAINGFKVGDKLFDPDYGDPKKMEKVKFTERGSKTIKTLDDAKEAARRFADYVS